VIETALARSRSEVEALDRRLAELAAALPPPVLSDPLRELQRQARDARNGLRRGRKRKERKRGTTISKTQ
jgi:uncharacterized membrane protein